MIYFSVQWFSYSYSYSWLFMLCMFYSFIFMVYFHGTRESGIWMTISHSYSARQKAFYVLTIPDNAFWPGDSCLDQPRLHLKFADDVMPSITSTISHNFALSNQRLSLLSGMSFALHQSGHRFGPPSGHIFMFVMFSVVRFSVAVYVNTLTQASNKKKITRQTIASG